VEQESIIGRKCLIYTLSSLLSIFGECSVKSIASNAKIRSRKLELSKFCNRMWGSYQRKTPIYPFESLLKTDDIGDIKSDLQIQSEAEYSDSNVVIVFPKSLSDSFQLSFLPSQTIFLHFSDHIPLQRFKSLIQDVSENSSKVTQMSKLLTNLSFFRLCHCSCLSVTASDCQHVRPQM
jgi:hypothetical protein